MKWLTLLLLLLPSAALADLTARWLGDSASDSLQSGSADSVICNTTVLEGLTAYVQFAGDSAQVQVSYSIDAGTSYTVLIPTAQLEGTAGTTAIQWARVLTLPDSSGCEWAGFIGNRIKIKVTNNDSATTLTNFWMRLVGR